jgi:hypothetical protein
MRGSLNLLLFLFTILQPQPSAPAQQQQSSNGMLSGMTIDHPERMSGFWELEVKGDDAIYGLHIQLTTKVHGAPATLTGARQIFHDASIEATGFHLTRRRCSGTLSILLHSDMRQPRCPQQCNSTFPLILFTRYGLDVFAVAALIVELCFVDLIQRLAAPETHL